MPNSVPSLNFTKGSTKSDLAKWGQNPTRSETSGWSESTDQDVQIYEHKYQELQISFKTQLRPDKKNLSNFDLYLMIKQS